MMMSLAKLPQGIVEDIKLLCLVIFLGGWGGIVFYIMRKEKKDFRTDLFSCFSQIVTSCFTGLLMGILALEKGFSFNMVLVVSGIAGVFASPILKLLGEKIKNYLKQD
nr:phage holin family protein [uncultured Enterobacter sp.]